VAHSYGGPIAREFLELCTDGEVQGLVLVDCLSEFAFKVMSTDQFELFKIFKEGQDWEKTVDLKGRTMLTKEE